MTAEKQTLSRIIRTVGRVDYNEERITRLHPKTEGWIEKLFIDKTGEQVRKDTILLSIYSPQLVSSQQEYLLALNSLQVLKVRRRVRTRFGLLSGLYAAFGGGVTAIVFLFDHGYQALSLFSAIIAVCGTGLMLKGELQLDPRHITMLWLPIPPSISLSLLYYMLPSSGSTDSFLLAMLISFSPMLMLYLLSTTVNWISKRHREMLWSILAVMTGTITYFGSYLLIVPPFNQVAGIYLGVFVASIIMYPVTAKSARQLFLSPLFFSLTGFAYTIVLGPVYRSLLLAAAAFLLFVSRYVKEKETMNPRLVYFRLVVLVALVACIATFAIATGLEILSTL